MLEKSGFTQIEVIVADRETEAPKFQTLLGIGIRPESSESLPTPAGHAI
jgi:hypothetical protein